MTTTEREAMLAPVVKSFSQSTRDARCLEVWFEGSVTDATRAWLLAAINEKAAQPETAKGVQCSHPSAKVWFYRDDDTYMICPDCKSRWVREQPETVLVPNTDIDTTRHRHGFPDADDQGEDTLGERPL